MSDLLNTTVPERILGFLSGSEWVCETIHENQAGVVLGCFLVNDPALPWVYVSAGIHGDEPAGVLAVEALLRHGVSPTCNWMICPLLNPSGFARGLRENADGTDLNRDYFFRSTYEVQAHVAWLEKFPMPELMLSLHEDWEAQGFYFYEINLQADHPSLAQTILQSVEQVMPIEEGKIIDDHEVRGRGWIYHEAQADFPQSWPEAIYFSERGCPLSLTFETPSMAFPIEQRVAAHGVAIAAAFAWWQENVAK